MSYTFLLFDLDHTLLDFSAGEEIALTQLLEAMGVEDIEAFKAYYKPMNQAMWKDLEQKKISKKELIDTRFSRAFAHFGRKVDGQKMALLYQEYLGKQGQTFEGVVELLQRLTDLGCQLYAATNGVTYIQKNRLAHSPIEDFFKDVFISEQMGTQKPEALFYEKIAEQIPDFDKSKALMIGDSLTADVQGGNNAGIDTVWYNPQGQDNQTTACPTYIVRTYQELLAIIQNA